MRTRTIRQTVAFKAAPHAVYEALIARLCASDGCGQGVNLELEPDKKIVQSWRAGDWMEGHFSHVTFLLEPVEGGTRLTFTQSGVPEDQFNDISDGWREHCWEPMKEMFQK